MGKRAKQPRCPTCYATVRQPVTRCDRGKAHPDHRPSKCILCTDPWHDTPTGTARRCLATQKGNQCVRKENHEGEHCGPAGYRWEIPLQRNCKQFHVEGQECQFCGSTQGTAADLGEREALTAYAFADEHKKELEEEWDMYDLCEAYAAYRLSQVGRNA